MAAVRPQALHTCALRLGSDPFECREDEPRYCCPRKHAQLRLRAEIAARIADELFTHLDAPVKRVAAMDTWVGYHPQLEAEILPQTDDLVETIEGILGF